MKAEAKQDGMQAPPAGKGRPPRRPVVTVADRPIFPDQFLPVPPAGFSLEDLNLRGRTFRAFERAGCVEHPEGIAGLRVADVLASWRNFGVHSLTDYLSAVERCRRDPDSIRPHSLEEEIELRLAPRGQDRFLRLIRAYYHSAAGEELTTIARGMGFGRERARQICAPTDLRHSRPPMPILDRLLTVADERPRSATDMLAALRKTGLVGEEFRIETLERAARTFGRELPPAWRAVVEDRAAVRRKAELRARVLRTVRAIVLNTGTVHFPDLINQLVNLFRGGVSEVEIRQYVKAEEDYKALNASETWFTLAGCTESTLARRIRQVLSICPRVAGEQLRAGLFRRPRASRIPPASVLTKFCEQVLSCKVVGEQIIRTRSENPSRVLSGVNAILVGIFRRQGPVCRYGELTAAARRRGVSEGSVNAHLARSSFFIKVGPGAYALIGTAPSSRPGVPSAGPRGKAQRGPRRPGRR